MKETTWMKDKKPSRHIQGLIYRNPIQRVKQENISILAPLHSPFLLSSSGDAAALLVAAVIWNILQFFQVQLRLVQVGVYLGEQIALCHSPLHWPHRWWLLSDPTVFCQRNKEWLWGKRGVAPPHHWHFNACPELGREGHCSPFNLSFLVVRTGLDCPHWWQLCAAESANLLEGGWIVSPLQLAQAFLPLYLVPPSIQSRWPSCSVVAWSVFRPTRNVCTFLCYSMLAPEGSVGVQPPFGCVILLYYWTLP